MRPRADRAPPLFGAAFCWRHAAGGGAGGRDLLGPASQPSSRPARRHSRSSLEEFVGSTLAPPQGRSRKAGAGRPEEECAETRCRLGPGSAGLRGRSWRPPEAAASLLRLLSRAESWSEGALSTRKPRVV